MKRYITETLLLFHIKFKESISRAKVQNLLTGADAEKINGSCPGKYTFSLLDEFERRRREVLIVGLSARLPGKFEDVKPPQIQFNAFSYTLQVWFIYFHQLLIWVQNSVSSVCLNHKLL